MAIGRALHRSLDSVLPTSASAGRRARWRHLALVLLALIAAATATVSLVREPPEPPPMTPSYLPAPPPAAP